MTWFRQGGGEVPSRANPAEPELTYLFGFFEQHIRSANCADGRRQDSRVFYNAQNEANTSLRAGKLSSHARTTQRRSRRDVSDSDEQRRGVGHQTNEPSYVSARPLEALKTKVATAGEADRH